MPWPANAASPWIRMGSDGNEPGGSMWSWLARTMPSTIGSTVSRWLGLAASSTRMSSPDRALVLADGAEVVLHVAGALHGAGIDVALELLEDLVVALADDVGEHVEAAAVGHAEHRRRRARRRRPPTGSVSRIGMRRLGALEPEALGADVLGGEELLERLGGVEPLDDAALAVLGQLERRRPRACSGSSAARRCPGCACTRCRWCGSTRRAARRAGRRASACRCRRRRR